MKQSIDELTPEEKQDCILLKLNELQDTFSQKIKTDLHKQVLFDKLHDELQQHKNGYIEKEFISFALDIISMIETVQKNCDLFENTPCTQERYDQLLGYYKEICDDVNDILYRHSIEPFSHMEPAIDVTKQKIIKIEETNHKKKDKTVAQRLSKGYQKDNKVIKQERITIFSYQGNKHLK